MAVLAVAAVAAGWFTRQDPSPHDDAGRPAAVPPPAGAVEPSPQAGPPTASAPASVPTPVPAPGSPPPASSQPASRDVELAADARSEMSRAKSAARGAGSRARQSPAYSAALAAEQEGIRLLRDGRATEAAAKFYQASGLFASAELTASVPSTSSIERPDARTPAAPAGSRVSPAGPTAAPSSAAPPEAVRPEPAGPPKPSESPRAAESPTPTAPSPSRDTAPAVEAPPAPAAPAAAPLPPVTRPERSAPPPSPPPAAAEAAPSAEDGIRDLLAQYEQALEGRSVAAMKRIWPTLDGVQEAAITNEFANARSIDVTIENPRIALSGPGASVTFVRRYRLLTGDGQRLMTSTRTMMTVRRAGGAWVIERIRFEAM
jgi:hypothetical protein